MITPLPSPHTTRRTVPYPALHNIGKVRVPEGLRASPPWNCASLPLTHCLFPPPPARFGLPRRFPATTGRFPSPFLLCLFNTGP